MGLPRLLERWTIFNLVGVAGMAVQLALVAFMVRVLGWHYLLATGLAVEAAVLHNFVWHHRWTWSDRPPSSPRGVALRLARFHLLNGTVSLAGNIGLTAVLSGVLHIDPVVSNLIAIAVCAGVNFAASNVVVFRSAPIGAVLLLSLAPAPAIAGPAPSTLAAWRAYEARLDAEYAAASSAPASRFLVHDRFGLSPGWRQSVMQGTPSILKIDAASIDDGKIHHWVGALFVPGVTVDGAIERVQQSAGRESDSYEDVLASRLIERHGNRARVFMKLRRQSVVTVTYNTEHVIEYTRIRGTRALVRSVAARITELADAGTAQEREKPADDDSGFLWRLNAYWRYEAVPGGVIVECESVSLSRAVPLIVRPVANPIVDRIARESLNRTLGSLRRVLAGAARAEAVGAFRLHLSLARGAPRRLRSLGPQALSFRAPPPAWL
jgi:putative flippase GtrA